MICLNVLLFLLNVVVLTNFYNEFPIRCIMYHCIKGKHIYFFNLKYIVLLTTHLQVFTVESMHFGSVLREHAAMDKVELEKFYALAKSLTLNSMFEEDYMTMLQIFYDRFQIQLSGIQVRILPFMIFKYDFLHILY